jgi:hypothetical protein
MPNSDYRAWAWVEEKINGSDRDSSGVREATSEAISCHFVRKEARWFTKPSGLQISSCLLCATYRPTRSCGLRGTGTIRAPEWAHPCRRGSRIKAD